MSYSCIWRDELPLPTRLALTNTSYWSSAAISIRPTALTRRLMGLRNRHVWPSGIGVPSLLPLAQIH